ncbi:MAG: transporter [Sphingomonadales bacterium]|nr:transporter [Sphingomonadales bacterium]MDE2570672.1 transporter [Sphingomonadales bacterium]
MTRIRVAATGIGLFALVALGGNAMADTTDASGSGQNAVQAPSTDVGRTGGLFAGSSFEIATGADYSAGHYGAAADTTVWSVPLDLKAQLGRLRLQASLPYEFIDGPGQLVGGVIVSAPGSTTTTARSGIGDLNLSGAFLLTRESGLLPSIEIGGGIKLPTAKTTIGTGEADYSVNASFYKTIATGTMLFGSVGYSWLGSPAAYQLENGLTASGGLNFRPASNQNYGVSLAYREPVAAGLKGQTVVSPYMTYRFSKLLGLTLYGMAGLNDASPRVGAGIRLTVFQ